MNKKNINKQKGFTLIELVIVIVILGILAATALPKFVDLSGDAKTAVSNGVSGAIASSASIQYAANKANSSNSYTVAAACDGDYLQTGLPTACTVVLSTNSCAVTCNSITSTVVLP